MAPETPEKTVLDCLAANYGVRGTLQRLPGENLNYLLTTPEGQRFVAKIVDDDMPPEVVEMEFQAIEYAISGGLSIDLPEVIQNSNGRIETGIKLHNKPQDRLRLIHFIDGIILETLSDISTNLLKNIGIALAQFNLAMQGFNHSVADRNHRWNLAEAGQHRDKTGLIEDPAKREHLYWAFDTWQQTKTRLKSLPQQFIHGDANRENILVNDDRVTGLVDFGDSGFNPTACELAICLAYIMMDQARPLDTAAQVVRGYHETRPLSEGEFSVMYPLICGRLAVSIVISSLRRTIDPDNPYWFGGEESAWKLLTCLRVTGKSRFEQRIGTR